MRKALLAIIMILFVGFFTISPVFADCPENCTPTSIFGEPIGTNGEKCVCDNGGSSVYKVIDIVIDVMTIGIGILGVIGISVVGIQYLTAGGNEEKTRKAKRRMFEIVIGLIAYVLIVALFKWLIPSFGVRTTIEADQSQTQNNSSTTTDGSGSSHSSSGTHTSESGTGHGGGSGHF